MKKLFKVLTMTLVIGFCGVLTSAAPVDNESDPICVDEKELIIEEEDLRCVIRNSDGDKLAACWFCDCAAVAKNIQ